MMKRICILTTAHSPYDDRIYYREAVSLKRADYNVTIVAPWGQAETSLDGINIVAVPKFKNRTERFLFSGFRVYWTAHNQHADIYHFHDPDLIPWMVLLALQRHKVIYDVHEYVSESILTKWWIPDFMRNTLASIVDRLEKYASTKFSGVITVNSHLETLFRFYNSSAVTVSNYPLAWFIEKCEPTCIPKSKRVLSVGGLNKDRGYELICESMDLLDKEMPDAKLMMIGPIDYDGVDSKYPRLESGRQLKNISWGGFLRFEEVPSVLAQAWVCWIPWQSTPNNDRGTPVKLFEYMASGRPVVASNLGFITPIIKQVNCGILVQPENPRAHADALIYLLTHPREAAEMGARGRRAVMECYNWSFEEKKLLSFYDSLLS